MTKSDGLFAMAAIYVAPRLSETMGLFLSASFLIFAVIAVWKESK